MGQKSKLIMLAKDGIKFPDKTISTAGPKTKNGCAGEDQQHLPGRQQVVTTQSFNTGKYGQGSHGARKQE
jgi:hypothetical protein